mgnify:CR=1 FL=1
MNRLQLTFLWLGWLAPLPVPVSSLDSTLAPLPVPVSTLHSSLCSRLHEFPARRESCGTEGSLPLSEETAGLVAQDPLGL